MKIGEIFPAVWIVRYLITFVTASVAAWLVGGWIIEQAFSGYQSHINSIDISAKKNTELINNNQKTLIKTVFMLAAKDNEFMVLLSQAKNEETDLYFPEKSEPVIGQASAVASNMDQERELVVASAEQHNTVTVAAVEQVVQIETTDNSTTPILESGEVALASTEVSEPESLVVIKKLVNLREGPSTNHPILMQLRKGQELIEFKREGNWVHVGAYGTSGKIGWVHKSLVSNEK